MASMKVALFPAKGAPIQITTAPIPTAGHGQLRVKVHACGVCHSDVATQYGVFGNTFPRVPGHEVAGVVDQVGEGVKGFKTGDRVGLGWFGGCCGECLNCKHDHLVHCATGKISGISFNGGYAEYTVADAVAWAHIPDDLGFEEAGPLMCAGVTVFNSMRHQGVLPGEVVAIQGIGGLGHLAIQYANKMGFKVVALSTGDDKAKLAKELGAHIYINTSKADPVVELNKLGGAKLIVATAPNSKAIESVIKGLAVGGKLLLDAAPTDPISISSGDLIMGRRSIVGWASGDARDSEDTMNYSTLQGVRAKIEVFPLDKAQEALDHMLSNKVRFRSVLKIA